MSKENNCKVYIDGKEVKGITSIAYEIESNLIFNLKDFRQAIGNLFYKLLTEKLNKKLLNHYDANLCDTVQHELDMFSYLMYYDKELLGTAVIKFVDDYSTKCTLEFYPSPKS